MIVKVLTLWEPWASFLVSPNPDYVPSVDPVDGYFDTSSPSIKGNETRPKQTNHRGTVYIQAAKRWDKDQIDLLLSEPYSKYRRSVIPEGHTKPPTLGKIIGRKDLLEVITTESWLSNKSPEDLAPGGKHYLEFMMGNYSPKRFAYVMAVPRKFKTFYPITGLQALCFDQVIPNNVMEAWDNE